MRKSMKITTAFLLAAIVMTFAGCTQPSVEEVKKEDTENVSSNSEQPDTATTNETDEQAAKTDDEALKVSVGRFTGEINIAGNGGVEYGDKLKVKRKYHYNMAGEENYEEKEEECEIVVSLDEGSEFAQWDWWCPSDPDYPMTEDEFQCGIDNVNLVIGKQVGDTFELSFEYGDGRAYFEYEILEISK